MRCRSGGARARAAAVRCVLLPLLLTGAALLAAPAAGQEASQLLTDSPNCRLADASAAGVLPAGGCGGSVQALLQAGRRSA